MDTTQYLDLLVTYREGCKLNNGNKNSVVVNENPSFSQQSMSSALVFDSVKNKYCPPRLSDSNSFGTVDYDAHEKK